MKQPNRIKAALRAGRKAYGYGLTFPSPWVIDILGTTSSSTVSTGPSIWSVSRNCAGQPSAII
jgi:hypothetical protein